MKRKIILYLLCGLCAMSLSLSACDKKEKENIPEDVVLEVESELPESPEPEQTPQPEISEEPSDTHTGIHPIHIMAGTSYENYWSDTYNRNLACAEYPTIQLEECCAEKYPELSLAMADLSAERKNSILSEYEYMIEQAAIQIQEMGAEYFMAYESMEYAMVRRSDSNVISILMDCYFYGGGAHGMEYNWGFTYDVKNEKWLQLSDVVTDMSAVSQAVQTELYKYYDPEIFFGALDMDSYFRDYLDAITWVLDYTGITFIFNPYELASYAAGSQVVTLSFAEYPGLIKEEYQQVPSGYGVHMLENDAFYYDVDGDGTKDQLSVFGIWDEYGDCIEKHGILIDDRRFEVETMSYAVDPYLIHTEDGNNYLYIQDTLDNDYRYMNIYKFTSDGAVEYVGILENAGWYSEHIDEGEYIWLMQELTDPAQYKLEGRTDVLSTLAGHKNYHTSESGMPVSEDKWYTHAEMREFTVLQDIEADIVDEATGEKTGTTTLSSGTTVLYYRTDDESFADLKLTDGTVVRVMVTMGDWPRTINGMDIETVFDGMMFAG